MGNLGGRLSSSVCRVVLLWCLQSVVIPVLSAGRRIFLKKQAHRFLEAQGSCCGRQDTNAVVSRKHKAEEEFEILGRALLPDLLRDLSLKPCVVSRNKPDFAESSHPWGTSRSSARCTFWAEERFKHGRSWAIHVHGGCSARAFPGTGSWVAGEMKGKHSTFLSFQERLVSGANLNRCTVNA